MAIHEESTPDMPNRRALLMGPIVLAGETTKDKGKHPVLIAQDKPASDFVKPEAGRDLMFKTDGVGQPKDVELKPLFRVRTEPHTVYFDYYTKEQWAQRQDEIRAEQARQHEVAARTVDDLAVGEMQAERDHDFGGEKLATGDFNGHKWRHAAEGGYMEFKLKVDGTRSNELVLDFWGGDAGNREFDVLVDDVVVKTVTLENNQPGKFFNETYTLDRKLTDGKKEVSVRLQAKPGKIAGGLYGARVLKAK